MAARHIEIAAEQGAKAGFNAWVEQMERSGLPAVQDALSEVRAQGNKKAQFDFYCAKFGKAIDRIRHAGNGNGGTEPEPVQVGSDVEALMAQIAALGAQVQALTTTTGVQVVADESEDEIPDDVDFSTTTTRRTTRTTTPVQGGKDPFTPRNPGEVSSSGRLWLLNQAGLLKLVDKPGKPITNGQAHATIRDNKLGRKTQA